MVIRVNSPSPATPTDCTCAVAAIVATTDIKNSKITFTECIIRIRSAGAALALSYLNVPVYSMQS